MRNTVTIEVVAVYFGVVGIIDNITIDEVLLDENLKEFR